MFDFNKVKEVSKLKFVGYGVNESVVVNDVTSGESQAGTPFIQINVKFEGDDDKNSTTLKLYMSPRAQEISMRKILHLHQSMNKKTLLNALNSATLADLAASLKALWINRTVRLKLAGEEYIGVDKDSGTPKTKVKLNIPFPPFAEAMTGNAEYPKMDKTKLVFDKGNKYDYKPIDEAQVGEAMKSYTPADGKPSEDDGMPF